MTDVPRVALLDPGDNHQRAMLGRLTDAVFDFMHELWYAAGGWDDRYRVYAILAGDEIVACAGVSLTDLLLGGRAIPAIQIGAVATLPDYRGQGLARRVMEHVLAEYAGQPAFLFAHQGVLDFYPKFGFRRVTEAQPYLALGRPVSGSGDCRRLTADDPDVQRRLADRRCYSRLLDVRNAASINLFHILMGLGEDIYHAPAGDSLVIARQKDSRLSVYDVISREAPSFDAILAALPFTGVDTVEFAFTPDWLCGDYSSKPYDSVTNDHYLFVRDVDWPRDTKFPYMSIT